MMSSRVLMMLCSLAMVIRCFLCHCNLLVQRGCGRLGPCFNLAIDTDREFCADISGPRPRQAENPRYHLLSRRD
jgi:hypothetical protein